MRETTIIVMMDSHEESLKKNVQQLQKLEELEGVSVVVVDEKLNKKYTGCGKLLNCVIRKLVEGTDIVYVNPRMLVDESILYAMKTLLYQRENIGAVGLPGDLIDKKTTQRMRLDATVVMLKWNAVQQVGVFDEELLLAENVIMEYGFRLMQKKFELYVIENNQNQLHLDATLRQDASEYGKLDQEILAIKWGMTYFNVKENAHLNNFITQHRNESFHVLEIGCDCGANLLGIKNRFPNAKLYGVEINESAASIASNIAQVIVNNIEDRNLPYEVGCFDYIVLGDVLEHLREPEETLCYCRTLLKSTGRILASIPNLMHISVMEDLFKGNFTYKETGVLDKTHIHMFTFNEIANMFGRAGFGFERIERSEVDLSQKQESLILKLGNIQPETPAYMYRTLHYLLMCKLVNESICGS